MRPHAATTVTGSLLGLAIGLAGCVDVPDRSDPHDRPTPDVGLVDGRVPDAGRPDRGPDAGRPDRGPDDRRDRGPDGDPLDAEPIGDARPDGGDRPDAGLPGDRCLPLREGVRVEGGPCLELLPAAPIPAGAAYPVGGVVDTADGPRLVIAGGFSPSDPGAIGDPRTWLYDPATDLWSAGPEMNTGRWAAGVTVDDDGALVVAGGISNLFDGRWIGLGRAERFDGAVWAEVPGQLEPGRAHGALVAVGGSRTLLVGGRIQHDGLPVADVDAITPAGTGDLGEALSIRRARAAAVRLPDGDILVTGGVGVDDARVPTPELGRPDGSVFVPLDGLDAGHIKGVASPLSDGALVVGGRVGPEATADAWRYDMRVQRMLPLTLQAPRLDHTVTAIGPPGGDWRLVVGGDDGGVVELYDPIADRFRAYALPAPHDRPLAGHVAAAVETDAGLEVLVAGGVTGSDLDPVAPPDVLRFRLVLPPDDRPPPLDDGCLPVEGLIAGAPRPCLRVRRGPSLPAPAAELAAGRTTDGRVFVSGGVEAGPAGPFVSGRTAVLHAGARSWTEGPELITPRWGHQQTVFGGFAEAVVRVFGGGTTWIDDGAAYVTTDTVEEWRQPNGIWRPFGATLDDGRVRGAATALGQGDDPFVWVGGRSSSDSAALQSGDYIFMGQTSPMNPNIPRIEGTMCVVGDDPLLFGGHNGAGLVDGGIQKLDPPQGPWSNVGAAIAPRSRAACIGHGVSADIFGGDVAIGGPPSDTWQRYQAGAVPVVVQLRPMGRARAGVTASAIGLGEDSAAAWLLVGGEDPADDDPPAVEVVYPLSGGGAAPQRFTVLLPDGVGLRRGHAAVSRYLYRAPVGELVDRDVVVIGGFDADGAPLDEVLIFTLEAFDPDAIADVPDPMD